MSQTELLDSAETLEHLRLHNPGLNLIKGNCAVNGIADRLFGAITDHGYALANPRLLSLSAFNPISAYGAR